MADDVAADANEDPLAGWGTYMIDQLTVHGRSFFQEGELAIQVSKVSDSLVLSVGQIRGYLYDHQEKLPDRIYAASERVELGDLPSNASKERKVEIAREMAQGVYNGLIKARPDYADRVHVLVQHGDETRIVFAAHHPLRVDAGKLGPANNGYHHPIHANA